MKVYTNTARKTAWDATRSRLNKIRVRFFIGQSPSYALLFCTE